MAQPTIYNSHAKIKLLLASISILMGTLIYILLRPSKTIFFKWINTFGYDNWINTTRQHLSTSSAFIPDWIIYSLPNGLWAFAYTIITVGIWRKNKSSIKYFWLSTIPILIFGYELLQLSPFLNGTFCLQDIFMGIAGILIGTIIGIKINKIQKL